MKHTEKKRHKRALLALDGQALDRDLLGQALRRCLPLCQRLDILLLNPPRETTSCLGMLLLRLEHSGLDYRVASAHGQLGEEVLHYLARHRGIEIIAVLGVERLDPEIRRLIQLKGHALLDLNAEAPHDA